MKNVLDNAFQDKYDSLYVVDCRFAYEYQGGHVKNALNFESVKKLYEFFFETNIRQNALIIFHCEFSQKRGPEV
jgi:M-phase inducer tyrosine phosphatase